MKIKKIGLLFFMLSLILLVSSAFAHDADSKIESEVGLTLSHYQYMEPDVMKIQAVNVGAEYKGKLKSNQSWFLGGDIIVAGGNNGNYSSYHTGSLDHIKSWYVDMRILNGKNFVYTSCDLSPYLGFGYRFLHNDLRGISTTGDVGYRRESNYLYLPIGIEHKWNLTEQSKLITNLEFDLLLLGKQVSYFSDIHPLNSDIVNWQKSGGYAARLSFMYQLNRWSIGPYLTYWYVNKSNNVYVLTSAGDLKTLCEPKNNTLEAGLKVSFHF